MNILVRSSALSAALTLLGIHTALADDYHYNNMLIGDRASGLGGTYTAISDDASGLFYNPAGIVYAGGRNLSASVNAYHFTNTSFSDVLGGDDWTRESSSLLPNYFGVIQPLGKGVIGFSYAVTDSIQENQDQDIHNLNSLVTRFTLNVNNDDNTYKLGPSYAIALTDHLSLGGTLYFHIRESETVFNQVIRRTDGFESSQSYVQSSEYGVQPVIGLMLTPGDRLSIGVTLRWANLILNSDTDVQSTCATTLSGTGCTDTTGVPITTIREFDEQRAYPIQLSVGVAYFPNNRLLYTADFSYYTDVDGEVSSHIDDLFRGKVATWNASAGVEYYFTNNWAVRTGIFTNNANTPLIASNRASQPEHIDMVGLSVSASRFSRNSSLTFGISHMFGSGEAQAVAGTTSSQDALASATTVLLSTSYNY